MKKAILNISFLCLLCPSFCSAQTKNHADFLLWQTKQNEPAMVYASTAYIRQSASTKGEIVDSLDMGDTIRIGEITKSFLTIKNIYAPWVKITSTKNGQKKEGYMWMGLLALGYISDSKATYLYGIDRITLDAAKNEDFGNGMSYIISLHALTDGKHNATKTWVIPDDGSFSYTEIKLLGDTKLQNLQQVVRIMNSGEACAIPTNYFYAGYTGNDFLELPGKQNISDAGAFSHSESLLFPNETGGKPGQIIRIITDVTYDDETGAKQELKSSTTTKHGVYQWDGTKAKKIK